MAVKKKFPYKAAIVSCNGGCRAVKGEAGCSEGCIGCGACVDACKFGAISLNEYGVAEVDESKCIACQKCTKVCPQEIIHIHECANYIVVKCSNKSKGAAAKKQCEASCIGCGICEKTCQGSQITGNPIPSVHSETQEKMRYRQTASLPSPAHWQCGRNRPPSSLLPDTLQDRIKSAAVQTGSAPVLSL